MTAPRVEWFSARPHLRVPFRPDACQWVPLTVVADAVTVAATKLATHPTSPVTPAQLLRALTVDLARYLTGTQLQSRSAGALAFDALRVPDLRAVISARLAGLFPELGLDAGGATGMHPVAPHPASASPPTSKPRS